MEKKRCDWCLKDNIYKNYHDTEWGIPIHDDKKFFEKLILDGAQAGLSWYTILVKRDNYKKAFANWDVKKVAKFDGKKVEELMQNSGIVRNRLKILSAIGNAKAFIQIQKEFGSFDKYVWSFVGNKTKVNYPKSMKEIPVTSPESDALSQDLKKRGMKFVGSTIIYAFMQAAGLVDDHLVDCFRKKIKKID
ncbi:MAG: DNA-3-methyladenine glycosylase I [Leptospiraceae bacterium]|nr:DNA-3-methyladenine glycosylase I [Leptospiraceae bacterium]